MTDSSHIPKGFHTINPYMIVSDAAKLIDFVKVVFNAEEVFRMDSPDGKIAHAEVRVGDSVLETATGCEEWPPMPSSLHIYVPDIDAAYQRALNAGSVTLAEPKDQFYGERSASVRDPLGNVWHIATKTEDLTLDEMKQRAAEYQASKSG